MELFMHGETWIALLTLTFLEIVLGIDNIIFISIVAGRLPEKDEKKARNTGLSLALLIRIGMLLGISWIIGFKANLFTILGQGISGRDLILMAGGLFLLAKSTTEIHHKMEGGHEEQTKKTGNTITKAIIQIILLDIVFSFDSILTAIGMTEHVIIMIIAVIISLAIMMFFAGAISKFMKKHPTLQILALSFLILIGFMLVLESLDVHVQKGYIYFAVFFSLLVEIINIQFRKKAKPVELYQQISEEKPVEPDKPEMLSGD